MSMLPVLEVLLTGLGRLMQQLHVVPLVQAVKELSEKNDALQTQINDLQSQINALRSAIGQ